jgi:predicted PurR-regulated permease PerM
MRRPFIRAGAYAWALVGVIVLAIVLGYLMAQLSLVIIPLVLALFPAAVLSPPAGWLQRKGLRPALATAVVMLGALGFVVIVVSLIAPSVAAELGDLGASAREGVRSLRGFLERGPLGFEPVRIEDLFDRARRQVLEAEGLGRGAIDAMRAVAEGVTGVLFGLVSLFFYLKDGPKIAAWLRDLFPERFRDDVAYIGEQSWFTLGAYIRGQLFIALVDAVLIGIGIAVLQVPLLLPLVVLVFAGGLFPIVGAVTAGALAVLVALATRGIVAALILLAVIVAVQQIEGHLLAPVVLGRATQLHPLATLAALAAGAVLLGVLGAFLAVPIAASAARAIGYLRERVPG